MPLNFPGYTGQATQPSAAMGPQAMSPEQKLASMMQAMGGAPNAVLMMIARILKGNEQPVPGPASNAVPMGQQWNRMYQMPQARPQVLQGINPEPMRPSEPPQMMNPNPGFVRG